MGSPTSLKGTSKVRLAIMSDLHCRLETDAYDSFLVVGQPRVPPEHHSVEALKELIDGHRLRADLLLVPRHSQQS